MAMDRQKLKVLTKLIDYGADTEKKITQIGMADLARIPGLRDPKEIDTIIEIQQAIKDRRIIGWLCDAEDEQKKEVKTDDGYEGWDGYGDRA
jgi:hypothetical protein